MKDFFIHQDQNNSVMVGGVVSLMNFAVDNIVVRVKGGLVEVNGQNLVIKRFDENEMIIVGKIVGVLTNVNR
ncbi:MAG: YabP/YqfC family sporulation protein [Clostridia bacterium]|nr:YabP/YqfC family sporulation protein [Clostridia bacterium]